jgi:lipoyl synthase
VTLAPLASAAAVVPGRPLRARWLGRVSYHEAWDLQRALRSGTHDHLLLLEHPPTYTLGVRARSEHLLADVAASGAEVVRVDRGGDVTFHGPGQLVGYPVLSVAGKRGGGMADTVGYVRALEQALIDALADLGLSGAGRVEGLPGVWVDPTGPRPRKVAAIGVKLARGRSMHGFALNVDPDLAWFDHIVPCGLAGRPVTSLRAEGLAVSMARVVEAVTGRMAEHLAPGRRVERSDVVFRADAADLAPFTRGAGPGEPIRPGRPGPPADPTTAAAPSAPDRPVTGGRPVAPGPGVGVRLRGRLAEAGVGHGLGVDERKPAWMRVKLRTDDAFRTLQRTARDLDLHTVCEEAGCPNIYECWNQGTATFMLLGQRCTRACGFCLVDTRKPLAPDPDEPAKVAEAADRLGLDFVVLTMVARDDLADGGASAVAATVEAIRARRPGAGVEVLISDLKGDRAALDVVLSARPDVVNPNIETVPRLQRAVRPSASYARSLALLGRAGAAGAVTKSGIIVGMGEHLDEVVATLADLAAVGVRIVTVGQYLRPTTHHLPVARWWEPAEFDELARIGTDELGLAHVEASPLTRSSYHAAAAASAAGSSR